MAHLSPHAYAGIPEIDIFIEAKGTHLLEKDAWKEEFLLQMRSEAIPVKVFRSATSTESGDYTSSIRMPE